MEKHILMDIMTTVFAFLYIEVMIEVFIVFLVFHLIFLDLGLASKIAAKIGGIDHVLDLQIQIRSFVIMIILRLHSLTGKMRISP